MNAITVNGLYEEEPLMLDPELAENIGKISTLRSLYLLRAHIDPPNLGYLMTETALGALWLDSHTVEAEDLRFFAQLKGLGMLHIRNSKTSQENLDKLRKLLPDTYVSISADAPLQVRTVATIEEE